MFQRMLDHPNLEVVTGIDHREVAREARAETTVWTGAIDEYFGCTFGAAPLPQSAL